MSKYKYILICVLAFWGGTIISRILISNTEPEIKTTDTLYIYKPIFETDTVKLKGVRYTRNVARIDTSYSHYSDGEWYERIDITSELKLNK